MSLSEPQSEPFLLFRLCKPGGLPVGWFRYLRHDNFHVSSAYGTSDCRPFFQLSGEQIEENSKSGKLDFLVKESLAEKQMEN
ncbi:MAG: hypothetical protein B5M55_07200 [Desulfococcus sp. 4484_242]|nr:MAG: hypothetical protein B5M55_07200 [Desulfococcus sp. 4484_242]